MNQSRAIKPNPWPFLAGDLFLLVLAGLVVFLSETPLGLWPMLVAFCAVGMGAWMGVWPFLLEHRAALKLAEADRLTTVVGQIQKLDGCQKQIEAATSQWQTVQEHSSQAVKAAQEIAERMAAETKEFFGFLERADQTEKNHLRLEVEKLRRGEGDWLEVLVHVFDHVYGIHLAAVHSGQEQLVAQLSAFQNACREAARKVGLAVFVPEKDEPFNGERHQVLNGEEGVGEGARIAAVLATGVTYQGQLVRKAVVTLDLNREAGGREAGETKSEAGVFAEEPSQAPNAPERREPGQEEFPL